MTNTGWRGLAAFVTIDIALLFAAGSAMAAPAAHGASASLSSGVVMPALLLLGVGLCGLPPWWRANG